MKYVFFVEFHGKSNGAIHFCVRHRNHLQIAKLLTVYPIQVSINIPDLKLNNLQLVNGDGGTYTIDKPSDVVVAPNSYYLFVASISGSQLTVAGDGSVELTDYNEPFELTPYRGSVTIQDPSSGVVIDSVSYGFELVG